MARNNPGPNDFHYEKDEATGTLVMKPGLGDEFEPTDAVAEAAARNAAELRELEEREEALKRAAGQVEEEANRLEQARAEMEERERKLAAREKALAATESRRKVATERPESTE